MFIWINTQGEFLVVSNGRDFGFEKITAYYTKDLNQAYVAAMLPKFTDNTDIDKLIPVKARVERKVYLTP